VQAATLASVDDGRVDAFLDVAAGFLEDLAHLAGHGPGDLFLPPGQDFADLED
jgi:hypothetical protein